MWSNSEFRQLLIADLVLMRGIAEARDVAAALQRYWDKRGQHEISISREIARIAGVLPAEIRPVEEEVDALIRQAGGDARSVIESHLGISRRVVERASRAADADAGPEAVDDIQLRRMPADRYTEFLPTGEGGMGIVYWALDTEMNRQVALKVVRPQGPGGSSAPTPASPRDLAPPSRDTPASHAFGVLRRRFLQEAWVTGGLEHPGIVPVYELGETDAGVPYYTMRFVRGSRTLATELKRVQDASFEERLKLIDPFLRMCDTMDYAHSRDVIHRDLKPENVALGEFGEVVILDWGLARFRDKEDLAASHWQARVQEYREASDQQATIGALGTPGYMSPEAAAGKLDLVDERSDIYNLGVMFFEILTGRRPFSFTSFAQYAFLINKNEAPDPRTVESAVPRRLAELCLKCLERDPGGRLNSVHDLAEGIRSWQAQVVADQEAQALLTRMTASLDAAGGAYGHAALASLDRAAAAGTRILELRPQNASARSLLGKVKERRQQALQQREGAARKRVLRRSAVLGLAVAAVVAVVVAVMLNQRRKAEVEARKLAETQEQRADREAKAAREQGERADREARAAIAQKLRADEKAREAALRESEALAAEAKAVAAKAEAEEAEGRASKYAKELEGQVQLAEQRFQEARRNLGFFHWESADRAAKEGLFGRAAEQYVQALLHGIRSATREELGARRRSRQLERIRADLSTALARTASAAQYLYPGVSWVDSSPDGTRLAACLEYGPVVIWDARTGEAQRLIPISTYLTHVLWLDSGTLVYIGGRMMNGAPIGLIDVATGRVTQLRKLDTWVEDVAVFPDRTKLALTGGDGEILVLDARTAADEYRLIPRDVVRGREDRKHYRDRAGENVALDADATRLAMYSRDLTIRLWNLRDRKELSSWKVPYGMKDIAFAGPDRLLVWDYEGLKGLDIANPASQLELLYRGTVVACVERETGRFLALTPGGILETTGRGNPTQRGAPEGLGWTRQFARRRYHWGAIHRHRGPLVPLDTSSALFIYDPARNAVTHRLGHVASYPSLNVFSGDGAVLLSCGDNFEEKERRSRFFPEVYDLSRPGRARLLNTHEPGRLISAVSVDGTGRRVATVDEDNVLRVMSGPDWTKTQTTKLDTPVRDIALSMDGDMLHILTREGVLESRRAADLEVAETELLGTHAGAGVVQAHPTGGVWVGFDDGRIELHETGKKKPAKALSAGAHRVWQVFVSKDGQSLAARVGARFYFWPGLEAGIRWTYLDRTALSGAFSSRGRLFALGHNGGDISVLDMASEAVVARYWTMDRNADALAFSEDDRVLTFQGFDNGPAQIALPARLTIERYRDHRRRIIGMAASPVGPQYASLDEAGGLVVRDLSKRVVVMRSQLQARAGLETLAALEQLRYADDGSLLVGRAPDRSLVMLDPSNGSVLHRIEIESQGALPFCVRGTRREGWIDFVDAGKLKSVRTGQPGEPEVLQEGLPPAVTRVATLKDGSGIAIGFRDGQVMLVNRASRSIAWSTPHPAGADAKRVFTRRGHDGVVLLDANRGDGSILVGLHVGSSAYRLDAADGRLLARRGHRFYDAWATARSRTHGVIVSNSGQNSYLYLSAPTGGGHRLGPPATGGGPFAFSHDETAILTANGTEVIVIPFDPVSLGTEEAGLEALVKQRIEASPLSEEQLKRLLTWHPLEDRR